MNDVILQDFIFQKNFYFTWFVEFYIFLYFTLFEPIVILLIKLKMFLNYDVIRKAHAFTIFKQNNLFLSKVPISPKVPNIGPTSACIIFKKLFGNKNILL